MLSEDLLSSISPNFDSQAFFNDFIFAGKLLSGTWQRKPNLEVLFEAKFNRCI